MQQQPKQSRTFSKFCVLDLQQCHSNETGRQSWLTSKLQRRALDRNGIFTGAAVPSYKCVPFQVSDEQVHAV